jgi:arginine/lysine/ornithine decarboxylase
MPKDLTDSVSGSTELVFPDGATGRYRLRERSVYEADEVREELGGDVPKYGSWLPVEETDTGAEAWLTAPSQLRSVLVEDEIRPGELFEIVSMTKAGHDPSDPYRVTVEFPERDGDARQSGLSSA